MSEIMSGALFLFSTQIESVDKRKGNNDNACDFVYNGLIFRDENLLMSLYGHCLLSSGIDGTYISKYDIFTGNCFTAVYS